MINNATVRRMYSKLVPAEVSHKLFWARYFYKVHSVHRFFCKCALIAAEEFLAGLFYKGLPS
jgi:hypothetical protein